MSLDGFSISALGLPKDITSAQTAASVERNILTVNDKIVGKIDRALNKKINNEEKEENNKNKYYNDSYEESEENEEDKEDSENSSDILDSDKDKKISLKSLRSHQNIQIQDVENVSIRVNAKSDKIELYNKTTNKILESIRAEDFLDMINNLDYNSGILVNLKI